MRNGGAPGRLTFFGINDPIEIQQLRNDFVNALTHGCVKNTDHALNPTLEPCHPEDRRSCEHADKNNGDDEKEVQTVTNEKNNTKEPKHTIIATKEVEDKDSEWEKQKKFLCDSTTIANSIN